LERKALFYKRIDSELLTQRKYRVAIFRFLPATLASLRVLVVP